MLPREVRSESRTIHPVGHNSDSGSNFQGRRRHPDDDNVGPPIEDIADSIAAAIAHVMPFLCPMTSPLKFGPLPASVSSSHFSALLLLFPSLFSPVFHFPLVHSSSSPASEAAMYFVASCHSACFSSAIALK